MPTFTIYEKPGYETKDKLIKISKATGRSYSDVVAELVSKKFRTLQRKGLIK